MANGAINFKNNSGNIVSFISGSGSDIIISGGTLNLSNMTGLTLGNLTMEGTVETASFAPSYLLTSSFNSYTGTTDNIIGSLQTSTSSLNSFTSSADSRLDTIEGVTGSYATTGSNTFNGNLTVTGYIDAQELRTTYISSSILYRSGSTKFGDELTDTHAFTGSLLVSGSISVPGSGLISGSSQITLSSTSGYGSVINQAVLTSSSPTFAGGTLTGALNGTIASFTLNQPSSSAVTITNTNTSSYLSRASFKANQGTIQGILEAGNSTVYIGSNSNHSVTLISNGAGAMVFTNAAADMLVPFQSAVSITNSTASTSKTTGALKVTGGVGVSGALNVGGDVVAYASSDRRLKDNIQNIKNPIQKVQKLNGVTWDWNSNADELQQSLPNVGVIAQEVEEVLPQLVHDRENGFKAVDYARLKEQQTQIQELKELLNQFIKQ